ncbi:hypothetical protein GCM10009854_02650 [Saccharopolyspora halophila]|uniref:Uncharacterized protein n=1 Tax=Saccharopolyspora halophila TaxID=405551 RepID=A0ABN3FJR5_9PSEU
MEHQPTGPPPRGNDAAGIGTSGEGPTRPSLAPLSSASRPPAGQRVLGLLGLVLVVSAALAGSLVLARTDHQARPAPTAEPIIGTLALRPDLVRSARWPFRANAGFAESGAPGDDDTGPPLDYENIANPSAGSPETALSVVQEFYHRVRQDPAAATELLGPELLNGQRERLSAAWAAADAVRVTAARAEPDGVVHTEVEVVYPGGERVLLRQDLRVAIGTVPHIVGAELRFARHVPAG